ncbi:hypothetical protein A3D84_04020 [Candidatus Woesebacteria bacterium RIFCSPHIGHO2_02_FULL_42_20]|uniref:SpoVT-AbrB domain-containing protein n=1 Tax=Candidatus Woesebacteria bacterium RIFCSPHIGHO2_12_FULL_41_24 TaxID=1802510 RepID=A0A1F8ARB2_9BACT|nr:MAG: hypothetical protein A2W15_00395 [Candidatus Woesebacteria bacterium RBG_16_41_13]OGM34148.1 MAG: hypothetical protein A3D84_04020 [Candidatus Woesebacteria bacterium RIFCSPHIGHO2_02_FULL_42_20]OGM54306.1 MAG: hypothetical protein A3E44_03950 [Candidatus Woesebacteria bacterium RIFCSPHIGHO2_12_FULL_41_24]OGM66557.1 MAG: hypothetical protein A2969_03260 [Candidatus Woesebacteria bacterium RIFCSPLOWO2_01_FULL_42_67]OGM69554.1 MAG: hypothetical protein A3I55_01020 [Candidatus Woesebacteria
MQTIQEQIVKIQPKGLITIPKAFRKALFEENGLARVTKLKRAIVIEPVRTLPYPVRSYTDREIEEFVQLDKDETKILKAKGLL